MDACPYASEAGVGILDLDFDFECLCHDLK